MAIRKGKKTGQINIRVAQQTVEDMDRIAESEARDRSELARFFLEWAMAQYERVGSLRSLLIAQVIHKEGAEDSIVSQRAAVVYAGHGAEKVTDGAGEGNDAEQRAQRKLEQLRADRKARKAKTGDVA